MRGADTAKGHRLRVFLRPDKGMHNRYFLTDLGGITFLTLIARRNTLHGSGLGKTRWVVERTISWLHNFRRLRIRFERLPIIHEAFIKIACCLICWR